MLGIVIKLKETKVPNLVLISASKVCRCMYSSIVALYNFVHSNPHPAACDTVPIYYQPTRLVGIDGHTRHLFVTNLY